MRLDRTALHCDFVPGAPGIGEMRVAYIIGGINRRERALEAVHFLAANVGLAVVSAHQVVVILDCCQLVIFRGELVRIIAEERALTGEEVVCVV
jgi:hypothetical protein